MLANWRTVLSNGLRFHSSLRPLSPSLRTRSLVIIKPDGVQRGLVGQILSRFEQRGLKVVGLKVVAPTKAMAEKHYEEHAGKPFFPRACRFLCSGPAVPIVLEGLCAVETVRQICGTSTDPKDCSIGTIRGDFGLHFRRNLVHSSDSAENAEKEISIWFQPHEICTWDHSQANWIYELENAPISFESSEDENSHPGHLEGKVGVVNPELPMHRKPK